VTRFIDMQHSKGLLSARVRREPSLLSPPPSPSPPPSLPLFLSVCLSVSVCLCLSLYLCLSSLCLSLSHAVSPSLRLPIPPSSARNGLLLARRERHLTLLSAGPRQNSGHLPALLSPRASPYARNLDLPELWTPRSFSNPRGAPGAVRYAPPLPRPRNDGFPPPHSLDSRSMILMRHVRCHARPVAEARTTQSPRERRLSRPATAAAAGAGGHPLAVA
jgi:hypothetical protein